MKRFLSIFFVIALICGCDAKYAEEFDDIRQKIAELNIRLDALCDKTNDNLEALQELLKAVEEHDYITSIVPVYENGNEIGYKISFFKGKIIVVYNGRDGVDGKPGEDGADGKPGSNGSHGSDGKSLDIGVKQGNDGNWYWIVNGSWMRDEQGNKVSASPIDGKDGEDGVTPRLKIIDDYWYLSLDGGIVWSKYGKATGDPGSDGLDGIIPVVVFADVHYDDANAYFILKSGDVISIPLRRLFSVSLDCITNVPIQAGDEISIGYVITGVDDETDVVCACEGGWIAEVEKENFFSGKINIRAPYPFTEGKVVVIASKKDGSMAMKSINFIEIEL